jgi:hypothetical protein
VRARLPLAEEGRHHAHVHHRRHRGRQGHQEICRIAGDESDLRLRSRPRVLSLQQPTGRKEALHEEYQALDPGGEEVGLTASPDTE